MSNPSQRPNRKERRLAFGIKVRVYKLNNHSTRVVHGYLLETRDITQRGLFLKTSKPFSKGTDLKLELSLEENSPPLIAKGRVAWIAQKSQPRYYPGVGIEIVYVKRGDGNRLKNFLREKFQNYRHAVELKNMYLQLKEMEDRLYRLEESHQHVEHFKKVIDNAIHEIDHIAHLIDKEVWEIRRL